MSESPLGFDLKFLPDWLKETPGENRYADHAGEDKKRSHSPGQRKDRRFAGKGKFTDKPQHKDRDRDRRGGERKRFPDNREHKRDYSAHTQHPRPNITPANVTVEFFPESHFVTSLAKQIKSTSKAYPLFGLARMFLDKPERHRVKISNNTPDTKFYQCGENGPVSFGLETLERIAFHRLKGEFYQEETIQKEPPKGNFSSVARCRSSGVLLGPTNYHAYQSTLHRLYEERFSRRMSFQDYQKQIEIVSDPETVEKWKAEASNVTTFKTIKEAEPIAFETLQETERHFKKHYLAQSIQENNSFFLPGILSRKLPDAPLNAAVREAWEKERKFPSHVVQGLIRQFVDQGLFLFKHRKRILFITPIRPVRLEIENATISENIKEILKFIESAPKSTRVDLAAKFLPNKDDEAAKSALVSDLHWLIHAGHIIEFPDGALDLPLPPKAEVKKENEPTEEPKAEQAVSESIVPVEEPVEAPADIEVQNDVTEEPPPISEE